MSVLNQSGEEQIECPLCMEPLEVDDLNFFPCTCGYQICRFCWHRIRLDENGGLCPACRKAYSENPADFIPLSREQVAKLKAEKKQRIQQRKAQQSESRKHLASVRVVQRNLVFVVGLPPRLADPEILKRHEYFGKFGKIHKVVINQSTSYAGSQGPSASAYVTYLKSDDALRAIQAVNNVTIDNRVIKSSLGTTKYCSHFMKNQPCPKGDCMYLHEYGDPEASFTREQMHLGKHQEYEKKLHEELATRSKAPTADSKASATQKVGAPTVASVGNGASNGVATKESSGGTNKENWPQLDKDKKQEKGRKGKTKNAGERSKKEGKGSGSESRSSQDSRTTSTSSTGSSQRTSSSSKAEGKDTDTYPSPELSSEPSPACTPPLQRSSTPSDSSATTTSSAASYSGKLPSNLVGKTEDNHSYFSSSGFALDGAVTHKEASEEQESSVADLEPVRLINEVLQDELSHQLLTDVLPNINTTEDWAAAFGFAASQSREQELLQSKLQQQQQQHRDVGKICDFLPMESNESFAKGRDGFNGFYEISKFQENLMDALANKTNGFHVRSQPEQPQTHLSNGLEQNMSKFFSDFHKYNSNQEPPSLSHSPYQNGFNGLHNPYQHILQQKQLEEQFRNLGLKQQNFSGSQTTVYQNGIPNSAYTNGDMSLLNGGIHNVYSKPQGASSSQTNNPRNSEAELDFDPFQETQKALAEIMAAEQIHKSHTSGLHSGRSGHTNGLIHSQNGSHIPPPPPGFVQQQQTHMNSFGSKILPFLSMSNSQQQINHQLNSSSSVSNNWPSSSLSSPLQQQQQKNISNTCNDWKVLDPAILRSSQSFQLSQQMGPSMPYQQQQQINNHQQPPNGLNLRSFDYATGSGAFSAFAQQLPPSFNTFTPPAQTNLNWFAANDVSAQISSPPGFRNGQTTKQQEC